MVDKGIKIASLCTSHNAMELRCWNLCIAVCILLEGHYGSVMDALLMRYFFSLVLFWILQSKISPHIFLQKYIDKSSLASWTVLLFHDWSEQPTKNKEFCRQTPWGSFLTHNCERHNAGPVMSKEIPVYSETIPDLHNREWHKTHQRFGPAINIRLHASALQWRPKSIHQEHALCISKTTEPVCLFCMPSHAIICYKLLQSWAHVTEL